MWRWEVAKRAKGLEREGVIPTEFTTKSMPITLKLFPKQVKYNISDTFKPNESNDLDVSDDILFHST